MAKKGWLFLVCCVACVGCADKAVDDGRNVPCGSNFCTEDELCCNGKCQVQDDHHCGGCSIDCTVTGANYCDEGVCKCRATDSFCSGTCCASGCVMTQNDAQNCGGCGITVPDAANDALHLANAICRNSEIVLVCRSGWMDANHQPEDGCEKPTTAVCGNGQFEEGERCDGYALNGQTCETIVGKGSTGTLFCKSGCQEFETALCSPPDSCGNGTIEGREVCDGEALNYQNCSSFIEGARGILRCASNCMDYDLSLCTTEKTCGNGQIDHGEECDTTDFGASTCATVVGNGSTGSLTCTSSCKISTSYCSAPSACGNGIINAGEKCDGSNLNGETCETVIGSGSTGTLFCQANCSGFETSRCTAPATCGNGIVEPGEACDGEHLNDKTCVTEVGSGSVGTLTCLQNCMEFDRSGCSNSTTCGNGKIDGSEVCDGTNVRGATCASEVGNGSVGTVLCGKNCAVLDISGCSAPSVCGNGTIDESAGEVCDGNKLNGQTCESIVGQGSTGTLACASTCYAFDTSKCSKASSCGNGSIDDGEVCDGLLLAGRTCDSEVGYGSTGPLVCRVNCMGFDTAKCTPEVKCGNGKLDAGEACDGNIILNATCDSVVGKGSTGTPACSSDCTQIVRGTCTDQPPCGNGKIDAGEACDKAGNLNGQTCEKLIGHGSTGLPVCNDTCTGFGQGTCTPEVKCGNGKLDSGEACDGTLLGSATCASVVGKGSTGSLSCDSSCKLVKTECSPADGCNNGRLDDGEECDGSLFRNGISSCKAYDAKRYASGNLKCNACIVDTSGCTLACGNGQIDDGEECDGANLNGLTCKNYFGATATGSLTCQNCKINTSDCRYCGDGKLNEDSASDEECDGNELIYESCVDFSSLLYSSGDLTCQADCTLDISACVVRPRCGDGNIDTDLGEACDGANIHSATCAEYLGVPALDGMPFCKSDCSAIDYSNCYAQNGCTPEATRCTKIGDTTVWQMCDEHRIWGGVDGDLVTNCAPDEACSHKSGCYHLDPDKLANPSWCYFQWLDSTSIKGYGRIRMPDGYTADSAFAQMLCTTDLSLPVNDWVEAADGTHNPLCDGCGEHNIEFETTSYANAPSGRNYCTFIFDFLDEGRYACSAANEHDATPILLDDTTTLTDAQTRYFDK